MDSGHQHLPRPTLGSRRFGGFDLDLARGVVRRPNGSEAALRPKAAEVLRHLAENAGRVVTRDELMQAVWPGLFVIDDGITQCVGEIRRALGEEGTGLLRTLPKRGYLLTAATTTADAGEEMPCAAAASAAEMNPPALAERRQIALMFCDLVGSTALTSELDPEDAREILTRYQTVVSGEVARSGGFVAHYIGDGVLAYFGYPQAHEDDAERAVRAGLDVLAAVTQLRVLSGETLQARIGVATGLVVVGDLIDTGAVREHVVVGNAANLAARLQHTAGPGEVVVDDATRRLTGGLFAWADLGEVALKGLPRPVRAWRVLREAAVASRFEALRGAEARTRLVGRGEELELLLRRWRLALAGDGQAVLVSGEPGIGKSRLLAGVRERLRGENHAAMLLSCAPDRQGSVLGPVIALLRLSAGFAQDDTAEVRWRKLPRGLPEDCLGAEDLALLGGLLSLPPEPGLSVPDMSPQRRKERTFEALLRLVAARARQHPLLLQLEDAHWADPSTCNLLDFLVERLPRLRCLLVVTHRPDFAAPWAGRAGVATVLLARLSQAHSAELIAGVAGSEALPPGASARIAERADGVPLFIEELTKATVEDGRAGPPGAAPGIPDSLQASLAARLDRHPGARKAAQFGAVFGRSFPYDLVAGLAELAPPDLEEGLTRLVLAGLTLRRGVPPDAVYTFSHALLQEAAYDSLLRSRRRDLHARALRLMEEHRPGSIEEEPETLARHAALAGESLAAARYLLRAGQRAMRVYALVEAEKHLSTALGLLAEETEDESRRLLRLDLRIALGQTLMGLRGFGDPAAGRVFEAARALAEGVGDWVRAFPVLHGQFMFHFIGGRPALAMVAAERMLEIAGRDGGRDLLHAGRLFVAMPAFHMGRFATTLDTLRVASEVNGPDGPGQARLGFVSDLHAVGAAYQALALLITGDVAAGDRADRVAWAAAERSRAAFSNAGAYCFGCLYSLLRGDTAETMRKLAPTIVYCKEQGYAFWLACSAIMRAACLAEQGRVAEGAALMWPAIEALRATGSSLMVACSLGSLAGALTRLDRAGEALDAVSEALDVARTADDRWYEAELHRIQGEAFLAAGDHAAAEASLRQAVAVARTQGAAFWELRAVLHLAPILMQRSARVEARDLLTEALSRIPAGADTAEMRQAEALRG